MKSKIFIVILLISLSAVAKDGICPEGEHWVRAHHRRAYYRANGTFVKATNVSAHCQGNPEGYDYWESKFKNERPANWPYKKEIIEKWTTEEKERIVEALAELPEVLWGNSISGIHKMDKSETSLGNPATSAEGIIVLYDSAFSKIDKTRPLARILAHELAHEHYRKFDGEKLDEYQTIAGWGSLSKAGEKRTWVTNRKKFVEVDGLDSPEEDFANNVEYFLFNPGKLRLFTPAAYDWIENHYSGKLRLEPRRADAEFK